MLILSKFHDYYDGVAKSAGIDKTIVFRRINTIGDSDRFHLRLEHEFVRRDHGNPVTIYWFILGFCGKTYHGIKVYDASTQREFFRKYGYSHKPSVNIPPIEEFCLYDIEARSFLVSHLKKDSWNFGVVKRWLDIQLSEELFIKHKTPILAWEGEITNTAPKLEALDFQKVLDPYTAYQEIQMYISGVLGRGEKDTVEVSDKIRLEGKGFDSKWSFRQQENRKTRKRK